MHDDVVTIFNYHAKTGLWYTSVFKNVHLLEVNGETATRDSSRTNDSNIELIIPIWTNNSPCTCCSVSQNRISYRNPDTGEVLRYIGPKAYANLENPHEYFTFKAETDFMVVGNYSSVLPLDDDEYDEGLYHAMNDAQDGVYMITSVVYYGLLPHFEIGGR